MSALLEVNDLSVEFRTRSGIVRAIDRAGFHIDKGQSLAVVGESGSGKSVTAFAIMGLLDPAARITAGSIRFGGLDILAADEATLGDYRGREVAMIFQSPRTALNPIRKVGRQIEEVIRRQRPMPAALARKATLEALDMVRIPDPLRRYDAYPFELSGGLCQRIMIAMALACRPALLIADEPTTGLDVTTQATIMELIRDLGRDLGMATLLITHDLAMAAEYCERIVVMHAGQVVEQAPTASIFEHARHPYTALLIEATPAGHDHIESLQPIPGQLPDLRSAELPACRFAARCTRHQSVCDAAPLLSHAISADHLVACRRPL